MLSETTLRYGERMIRALLGVDGLYRSESGDAVGLAVLNMDTGRKFEPDRYDGYAAAASDFATLREAASDLPEPDRRVYYDQLCGSTLAFISWRTGGLPFETQLSEFLHIPAKPAADHEIDAIESELHERLVALGYSGDVASQCAAWEARHRVRPENVEFVLSELMTEAWDRTNAELVEIPAPKADAMTVEAVTDVAFNARCNYAIRRVEINVEPVLTRPALKHLAVHEGCPGHYVQFKLRETLFHEGQAAADVLLSLVNSASSCVFEGIADSSMRMIDWEDDDDRVQALIGRHRAGIGTGAAWRLHALGWAEADVSEWLASRSLVGGDGWVKNRMAFIAAPERAVLIWSYWWGERSVGPVWDAVAPSDRADFIRFLYGRMHSTSTVSMFDPMTTETR
jgi:hypothetical protein